MCVCVCVCVVCVFVCVGVCVFVCVELSVGTGDSIKVRYYASGQLEPTKILGIPAGLFFLELECVVNTETHSRHLSYWPHTDCCSWAMLLFQN